MNASIIKLVVAAAMVFTPVLAMAQWKVGVEGGIVRNTLLVSKCYDYDRHYISGTSGIIGIPVRYDFHDWFGLQAEVSCLTKNYSMYRSDIFGATITIISTAISTFLFMHDSVSEARNCADIFLPAASSERGWRAMWKATNIDISNRIHTSTMAITILTRKSPLIRVETIGLMLVYQVR